MPSSALLGESTRVALGDVGYLPVDVGPEPVGAGSALARLVAAEAGCLPMRGVTSSPAA